MLILAGGLATRLGAPGRTCPKAMMEVAGKPFIAHQLALLKREGVSDVVLCVSHLADQIEDFVQDGSQFGLRVVSCRDGETRLGMGGAVKKASKLLSADFFAVLYGDTYLDISFAPVLSAFLSGGKNGLMTVLSNRNQWGASNVLFENGTVRAYDKNHPTGHMQHIDYGLSILSSKTMDRYPPGHAFDLAEVFGDLITSGDMSGFEVTQRFYEIGTPNALQETEQYLISRFNTNWQ